MTDSVDRLYKAILAARELDPGVSRTARLFQRGHAKMAKKLAEEAIEVVIDAMNGDREAVARESADLIYNLTVIWAATGLRWTGASGCSASPRNCQRQVLPQSRPRPKPLPVSQNPRPPWPCVAR